MGSSEIPSSRDAKIDIITFSPPLVSEVELGTVVFAFADCL
jgi:hypothetical protein